MEQSFAATTRTITTYNESGMISTTFIPFPAPLPGLCENRATKESNMYDMDFEDMDDGAARTRLICRANEIRDERRLKGERLFGIADDEPPKTFEEQFKRISEGKYTWKNEKHKNDPREFSDYWEPTRVIRWRSPDKKEDRAGFDAWWAKQEDKYTKVIDSIYVDAPSSARTALYEFEDSPTFH